ncbi:hypothetical protein [Sorangium cellulosum]|uniref:hypothetical protein n=1 Tax=Sorangium cellulosum TaxID=56 RepID=UPI001F2EE7A8|nr:hypothetical protein [Sorangium cellulosum]
MIVKFHARGGWRVSVLGALAGLLSLGCSTSAADGNGAPDAGLPDGSPAPNGSTGDPTRLVGSFQVRSSPAAEPADGAPEASGSTSVLGKIYDGPTPAQLVWEVDAEEGPCQLLTPRVPFCNQPCGGSAVCVEDDTCQAYPAAHSAGDVTVTGLSLESGEASLVMKPTANNYQPPAGVKLRYPPAEEGQAIRFEASGDYFSAFTLEARGVLPLDLLNDTILLEPDQALQLTWAPPGQAGISTIHVKLDISHHGGTKGMLECAAEDTGSLDLPAALVTRLLDLGAAGFPSIAVTRRAVGSATIAAGRVDLVISSLVERPVEIPGLTSCNDTSQCPEGQTCQTDLTCQ